MAYTGTSIIDYLKSVGQPSDFASRAKIAQQLGIQNYTGTQAQNDNLLAVLNNGPKTVAPAVQPAQAPQNAPQTPAKSQGGGSTTPATPVTPTTTTGGTGGSSGPVSGGLQSTGDPKLDQLQDGFKDYITGSLSSGFQVNPGLNITPDVIAGFVASTIPQLNPKYTQNLESTINDVNTNLNKMAVDYANTRDQTVQDYQQSLGKLRDSTSMVGGGEAALERGLTNSANRSLSSLDTDTAANFSKVLNTGGAAVGQGINGGNVFGANVPGLSGSMSGAYGATAGGLNQGSFVIPSLYGRTLSNQGGDSVFAGSANTGNALNYSYNPSMYQYGSIPSSYASDFLGQLNQSAKNYQQGQNATGGTNITSSSGLSL